MFILDSLMISGIRWALETALTAAEAEMNDDSVLREQLLEAEMRREMGEISDDDFRALEADLLARIREIRERRDGGAGPLAFGPQPLEAGDGTFQVEASVSGDFHDPAAAPHTTVLAPLDEHHALASLVSTAGEETIEVLDMEPGDAVPPPAPAELPVGSATRNPPHREGSGNPPYAKVRGTPSQTGDRRRRRSVNDGRTGTPARDAAVPSAEGGRVPRHGAGGSKRSRATSRGRVPQKTP